MLRRALWASAAVAMIVVVAVLIPIGLAREPHPVCIDDPTTFPAEGIAGWRGDQLENAALIAQTATALGFDRSGQVLGVMAAMGESSLRNIDYGDWETSGVTNPDGSRTSSIGLFQQQEWWGSVEERMDPGASAVLFYERLGRLDGWWDIPATHAIHRVQVNADSEHYARFQADAEAVVDGLSGAC